MTRQEAYQWLLANEGLITNVTKMERDQQYSFFAAYNALSSTKKTQTSCARCIHSMRVYLQSQIKTIKIMDQYPVYRTPKGQLTFTKYDESIFIIRATTKEVAKQTLQEMKALEKAQLKKD